MSEYTFTCLECNRTFPISEESQFIHLTCKSCADVIMG